ncbi:MAG: dihydrofolate reductase [Acidimicrobiia bacterium]|nr:dihydrofolate reductase [Acidimicrobiia bacterium]
MPNDLTPEADRDNDVVASLAVTLDGYVSRADGAVDFLDNYPLTDFDFDAWAARVGALVMGRTTYEQTIGWGWIWGERPTLVLTTATDLPVPEGADITFRAAPTAQAVLDWSQQTPGRLWVFGGGNVVTAAMLGGVVDTLDVTVIPEALGAGIPLFTDAYPGPLRLLETTPYDNGCIRLVYDSSPSEA